MDSCYAPDGMVINTLEVMLWQSSVWGTGVVGLSSAQSLYMLELNMVKAGEKVVFLPGCVLAVWHCWSSVHQDLQTPSCRLCDKQPHFTHK